MPKATTIVGCEVIPVFPATGHQTTRENNGPPDDNSTQMLAVFEDATARQRLDAAKDMLFAQTAVDGGLQRSHALVLDGLTCVRGF